MNGVGLVWLLTWLWQAGLVTAVAAVALRSAPILNASTRYLVWWIVLGAVLLLAIPAPLEPSALAPGLDRIGVGSGPVAADAPHPGLAVPIHLPEPPVWLGVGLTLAWAVWVGVAGLRLGRAVVLLQRVKRACRPLSPRIEARLTGWMKVRHDGRRAVLRLSDDVSTACMLGLGTPVIALGHDLVTKLSVEDLDAVVLHEHGHVQRRDDWMVAVQAGIEAIVGWHPAVWWIGRQLRTEREIACDDRVVARGRDAHGYAACLARVAGLAVGHAPPPAPAVLGRGLLTSRIDRLLDHRRGATTRPTMQVVTMAALACSTSGAVLGSAPPLVTIAPAPVIDTVTTGPPPARGPRPFEPTPASAVPLTVAVETAVPVVAEPPSPAPLPSRPRTMSRSLEPARLRSVVALPSRAPLATGPVGVDATVRPGPIISRSISSPTPIDAPAPPPGPWSLLAAGGRAVGTGATQAGLATASAFEKVGFSIASAFRPRH